MTTALPDLTLRSVRVSPALFLAPMAGVTHAPFRRLVSDFGGHGALFTEMLSARSLLHEDLHNSPFVKRRVQEGSVWYQLLLNGEEDLPAIIDRLKAIEPFALDINLACPAPEILKRASGAALFRDQERLARVLSTVRHCWPGILSVKCRIGDNKPDWQETLARRLKAFEAHGIDAIFMHPRFFDEKLKRRARWEALPWVTAQTSIPVIGNGDVLSVGDVAKSLTTAPGVRGIMLGRIAAVQPWIFATAAGKPPTVDYAEVWTRLLDYLHEDFASTKVLGRIKEFTAYYARNFFFGHQLFAGVQSAETLDIARIRAVEFLSRNPQTVITPTVAGV